MRADKWLVAGLALASACLTVARDVRADSLTCKDRIVSTGDSSYQVRAICGDPDAVTHRVEYRTIRQRVPVPCGGGTCWRTIERAVEVPIEEWTYDFGRNRFIQFVTFEDSTLLSVRTGGYGYK
jgi:hypothetical protein